MAKRIFAVVHVETETQAIAECVVAQEAGCDGVFLIAHLFMRWSPLLFCVGPCREVIPYVGINMLDMGASDAVRTAHGHGSPRAVWTDATFCGIKPLGIEVFSGFAFKHQPKPSDLFHGAQEAAQYCDVVTTSGPGTGQAAPVAKVQEIRGALDAMPTPKRLGLASGVSEANVESYLPYVDDFLVATSILTGDRLDRDKTTRLVNLVKQGS